MAAGAGSSGGSNSTRDRYVLGVDGGGTKTEAWLARLDAQGEPHVVGKGRAASSNPRAVGLETALANLGAAIDAAWSDHGAAPRTVERAVLAISGAGHAAMREKMAAWAQTRRLAQDVRFEHDAAPVLAAGTPEGWGVALIVGTGSAAIGINREGRQNVVGGWGYHYGDEGSAYWIGRRALESVARSADGRDKPTALIAALVDRLQVDEPRAMLNALERTGNVRGAIAGLADVVESVARSGDDAARRIVEQGAAELAHMVATLARSLGLGRQFPLALAGGVICGSELMREHLGQALAARGCQAEPVATVPHPVVGCLRLACAG